MDAEGPVPDEHRLRRMAAHERAAAAYARAAAVHQVAADFFHDRGDHASAERHRRAAASDMAAAAGEREVADAQ